MHSSASVISTVAVFLLVYITSTSATPIDALSNRTVRQNWDQEDQENVQNFADFGGSIDYEGYNSGRIYGATATLNSKTYDEKFGSDADGNIEPSGWDDLIVGNTFTRQRCHTIGKQLGGSGKDARNLFTCWNYANNPMMLLYENKLADLLASWPGGGYDEGEQTVEYKVELIYMVANLDYPSHIRMTADIYLLGTHHEKLFDFTITNSNKNNSKIDFHCHGRYGNEVPPSFAEWPTTELDASTTAC